MISKNGLIGTPRNPGHSTKGMLGAPEILGDVKNWGSRGPGRARNTKKGIKGPYEASWNEGAYRFLGIPRRRIVEAPRSHSVSRRRIVGPWKYLGI